MLDTLVFVRTHKCLYSNCACIDTSIDECKWYFVLLISILERNQDRCTFNSRNFMVTISWVASTDKLFDFFTQVQLVGAMGQHASMTHIIDVFRGSFNEQVCIGLPRGTQRLFPVLRRSHVITSCSALLVNYLLEVVLSPIEIGNFPFAQINNLTKSVLLGQEDGSWPTWSAWSW